MLGIFLLGIFLRGANARGVLAGSVIGLMTVTTIAVTTGISFFWFGAIGCAVTMAFGYCLCLIAKNSVRKIESFEFKP